MLGLMEKMYKEQVENEKTGVEENDNRLPTEIVNTMERMYLESLKNTPKKEPRQERDTRDTRLGSSLSEALERARMSKEEDERRQEECDVGVGVVYRSSLVCLAHLKLWVDSQLLDPNCILYR